MDYSLAFCTVVALLSHFCRTCKRYHKQDAGASESSAYNGKSQTHPSRERGHNKLFTPARRHSVNQGVPTYRVYRATPYPLP